MTKNSDDRDDATAALGWSTAIFITGAGALLVGGLVLVARACA